MICLETDTLLLIQICSLVPPFHRNKLFRITTIQTLVTEELMNSSNFSTKFSFLNDNHQHPSLMDI